MYIFKTMTLIHVHLSEAAEKPLHKDNSRSLAASDQEKVFKIEEEVH